MADPVVLTPIAKTNPSEEKQAVLPAAARKTNFPPVNPAKFVESNKAEITKAAGRYEISEGALKAMFLEPLPTGSAHETSRIGVSKLSPNEAMRWGYELKDGTTKGEFKLVGKGRMAEPLSDVVKEFSKNKEQVSELAKQLQDPQQAIKATSIVLHNSADYYRDKLRGDTGDSHLYKNDQSSRVYCFAFAAHAMGYDALRSTQNQFIKDAGHKVGEYTHLPVAERNAIRGEMWNWDKLKAKLPDAIVKYAEDQEKAIFK